MDEGRTFAFQGGECQCPFHTLKRWQEMRTHEPVHFWYSANLEKLINERRATLGLDPVWFSSKLKPLDEATTELEQHSLFDESEWRIGVLARLVHR